MLQYTKQMSKIGLQSCRILAILFHEVDMRNIYSSDSKRSDKALNIKAKIKA